MPSPAATTRLHPNLPPARPGGNQSCSQNIAHTNASAIRPTHLQSELPPAASGDDGPQLMLQFLFAPFLAQHLRLSISQNVTVEGLFTEDDLQPLVLTE